MASIAVAAVVIGGAIINTIGNVQKSQAQAAADKQKASELEELSKPGGYYDQALNTVKLEYQNIQASREAAGQISAMNALQVTQKAAQEKGSVIASAGAGNLAQTGSIIQRQVPIKENENISLAKNQLQYEQQMRTLNVQQSQATAEETKLNFQKTSGSAEASQLESEAGWLNSWGVGLDIAGGLVSGATALMGSGALKSTTPQTTNQVPQTDPYVASYGTSYGTYGSGGAAGVSY
jgi:hypothetical protein